MVALGLLLYFPPRLSFPILFLSPHLTLVFLLAHFLLTYSLDEGVCDNLLTTSLAQRLFPHSHSWLVKGPTELIGRLLLRLVCVRA